MDRVNHLSGSGSESQDDVEGVMPLSTPDPFAPDEKVRPGRREVKHTFKGRFRRAGQGSPRRGRGRGAWQAGAGGRGAGGAFAAEGASGAQGVRRQGGGGVGGLVVKRGERGFQRLGAVRPLAVLAWSAARPASLPRAGAPHAPRPVPATLLPGRARGGGRGLRVGEGLGRGAGLRGCRGGVSRGRPGAASSEEMVVHLEGVGPRRSGRRPRRGLRAREARRRGAGEGGGARRRRRRSGSGRRPQRHEGADGRLDDIGGGGDGGGDARRGGRGGRGGGGDLAGGAGRGGPAGLGRSVTGRGARGAGRGARGGHRAR